MVVKYLTGMKAQTQHHITTLVGCDRMIQIREIMLPHFNVVLQGDCAIIYVNFCSENLFMFSFRVFVVFLAKLTHQSRLQLTRNESFVSPSYLYDI